MNKQKEGDTPHPFLSGPQCLIRKGPEAERLGRQAPSRVGGRVGKGTASSPSLLFQSWGARLGSLQSLHTRGA